MSKNEVEKTLIYEKFDASIVDLLSKAGGYSELYGYDLSTLGVGDHGNDEKQKTIRENLLTKFLVANKYELENAKKQFVETLKWRKAFNPLSAAFHEKHEEKFGKVGLITNEQEKNANKRVITWNLYGAVQDRNAIFGNLDEFLRWRVGLMELGISLIDFSTADTSYMIQIHDYANVSFFRLDSSTKAASSATIHLFQSYYPEFLKSKFFVNVPAVMSWMFTLVKPLLSKETIAKFVVLGDGKDLESKLGSWVPEMYGGKKNVDFEAIKVTEFEPKDETLVNERIDANSEPKSETKRKATDETIDEAKKGGEETKGQEEKSG